MAKKIDRFTVLFYLIIFLLGAFGALCIVQTGQLTCNRFENVCYVKAAHLWEFRYKTLYKISLSDIQSAEQTPYQYRDSKGNLQTSYKTTLKTKRGNIDIFKGVTFSTSHIASINQYLASTNNDLSVSEARGPYYVGFLGFFIFLFLGFYIDILVIKRHRTHPVVPSKYSLNKLSYKYLLKRQNLQSYQSPSLISDQKPITEKQLKSSIFNHLKNMHTFNTKFDTKTDENTSVSQPNGGVERF